MHLASILNIIDQVPAWFTAITGVVTAASAVTALTPSRKDDKVLGTIVAVLNVLALNVGHAKPQPKD